MGATEAFEAYLYFLKRFRFGIMATWIVVVVLGLLCAKPFFDGLGYDASPPEGSPSRIADAKLEEYFPGTRAEGNLLVVIQSKSGKSVLTDNNKEFTSNFTTRLLEGNEKQLAAYTSTTTYWGSLFLPTLARRLVSNDNTTTIILLDINQSQEMVARDLLGWVEKVVDELRPFASPDFRVMVTGEIAFHRDISETAQSDMRVDVVSMPISLAVLGYSLRSFRLAIMPLFCVGISLMCSFAIMYGVMQVVEVSTIVPNVMMALTTAMSLDYCLFLFSRYGEELRAGHENETALVKSLGTAGEMVLISGTTLFICSLSMTLLPMEMIQVIGLGCSVAVMNTMLVALTLIPALVHTLPKFFANSANDGQILSSLFKSKPDYDGFSEKSRVLERKDQLEKSRWFAWTLFVLKNKYSVLLLVLISMVPMTWLSLHLKTQSTVGLTVPQHSQAAQGLRAIEDKFGGGAVMPYTLVVVPKPPITDALSKEFFDKSEVLIRAMLEIPDSQVSDYTGLLVFNNSIVTYEQYNRAMDDLDDNAEFSASMAALTQESTNKNSSGIATAQSLLLTLSIDPSGPKGQTWLRSARKLVKSKDWGVDMYIAKGVGPTLDNGEALVAQIPLQMTIMCAIVFLVLYIAFKSVVVPIRAILSLAFTLVWTFGMAQLIFHDGILDWMGWFNLSSHNMVHWVVPILSLSLICGITLDCDIFLLTRILEFREEGYTDQSSVALGVFKTAGIITSAGVIMGISFGSNMISKVPLRTANVFMISFAVVFDTFVVRATIMPAVMGILDRYNFWPRKLPVPSKTAEHAAMD